MSRQPIAWTNLPAGLAATLGEPFPPAAIVKENPQRTIYRVHLCGRDLHVKHCRTRGWRAWLRDGLRGPKARLEYSKLNLAAARNVPTASAVAAGSRRGESFLITETIANAIPLAERLAQAFDARSRIRLALALGRFLAGVHHAGVRHPDLHPGNILVRDLDTGPELFLLDLHDARISGPLAERASLANLIVFNRWFILRVNRSDRLRCWRAYVTERWRLTGEYVVGYERAREVERRTWASNRRFWRGRMARCLATNRRFRSVRGGFAVADLPKAGSEQLLRDPDALFYDGKLLKNSRSSTVALLDLSIGNESRRIIVKRTRCQSVFDGLLNLFRPSPTRRAWVNGHALLDCLLPTARPHAMWHCYRVGLPRDGYLVTEFIADAINLRDALFGSTAKTKRERIVMVARLVRKLHERGWSHRDLKAANILLAPDAQGREAAWLIDLAGARRPFWLTRGRRVKDLVRLNASFHDLPALSSTDRLRFLLLYLNANLHGRGDWKSWWRAIQMGTSRKIAENQRRGRPLA